MYADLGSGSWHFDSQTLHWDNIYVIGLCHIIYIPCVCELKMCLYLLYMYGYFPCMYACVLHVYSDCRGQRMVSDPLKLELQMVASHHVGAEN